MFYLIFVDKILRHCHSWLARQSQYRPQKVSHGLSASPTYALQEANSIIKMRFAFHRSVMQISYTVTVILLRPV